MADGFTDYYTTPEPTPDLRRISDFLAGVEPLVQRIEFGDEAAYDEALALMKLAQSTPPVSLRLAFENARKDAGMAINPSAVDDAWDAVKRALDAHKPKPAFTPIDTGITPAARRWIINDWLPSGRVGLLTGEGGVGKTRLALQLAAAIAGGGVWIRSDISKASATPIPAPAPVAVISYEDEPDELTRRAIAAGYDSSASEYPIWMMRGRAPLWAPGRDGHISQIASPTEFGIGARDAAAAAGVRLLVIDNIAGAYHSDENARAMVRAFMTWLDGWAIETDCAVLLVGHPPKANGGGKAAVYSGSTDWRNAARYAWTLCKSDADDEYSLKCDKQNYALSPDALTLRLNTDRGAIWEAVGID